MKKRDVGYSGEDIAAGYLEKNGLKVITKNYYTPYGEIDIIAEDSETVVFVEVKARQDSAVQRRYGRPASAVNKTKREHLVKSAYHYLSKVRPGKKPRIDIIELYFTQDEKGNITPTEIKWLKSAVGRGGRRV